MSAAESADNNFVIVQSPTIVVDSDSSGSKFVRKREVTHEESVKLSTFEGALAVISSLIGGGLLVLPYAFLQLGIPAATLACLVTLWLTVVSCELVMKARDMVP